MTRTSRRALLVMTAAIVLAAGSSIASEVDSSKLRPLVDGPQRSVKDVAGDHSRHPYEVLNFFGVGPDATVVEIDPGGAGYWTEILAPYLKDRGRYIAANG